MYRAVKDEEPFPSKCEPNSRPQNTKNKQPATAKNLIRKIICYNAGLSGSAKYVLKGIWFDGPFAFRPQGRKHIQHEDEARMQEETRKTNTLKYI